MESPVYFCKYVVWSLSRWHQCRSHGCCNSMPEHPYVHVSVEPCRKSIQTSSSEICVDVTVNLKPYMHHTGCIGYNQTHFPLLEWKYFKVNISISVYQMSKYLNTIKSSTLTKTDGNQARACCQCFQHGGQLALSCSVHSAHWVPCGSSFRGFIQQHIPLIPAYEPKLLYEPTMHIEGSDWSRKCGQMPLR